MNPSDPETRGSARLLADRGRDHPARLPQRPTTSAKIRPEHRDRLAVVYVRQSSPQQVVEHRESAARQYDLARRAVELGWPGERVLIIDEDQGRSAQSAEGRPGFQRLLAEVGLDHVGLVLGLEMSRLARSCKDWYQLLELCALFRTLLADQDGLYDPTDYNDRLLLGLRGMMSEAELHVLRSRLNQGRLNKAARGELFSHPPIGYVGLPSGGLALEPDEQARSVVRLIFEVFEEVGTVNQLLQYLARHGIRLGIRPHSGPNRGRLEWRRPCRTTLLNMLHHPTYAGAYCYGRRPIDPRRRRPDRPGSGRHTVPAEGCQVLLPDHSPAYISWERYQANQRRIAENRAVADARGAVRGGPALLGGLIVCGRCGCRMMVQYSGRDKRLSYACLRRQIEYGGEACQGLAGRPLDACVGEQVLRVLEPSALELSLTAADQVRRERDRLDRHWRQRLERAGYEVDLAARQYQAVDPENRLVARALERRWEEALRARREVEESYHRFRSHESRGLARSDRDVVKRLATDIPALWSSAATTAADRQAMVRHLVERVVAAARSDTEFVDVTIHWAGGATSRHEVIRPVARYEQLRDYGCLVDRVAALRDGGLTAGQIAERLNEEGWRPPRRATFHGPMVRKLLSRLGLIGPRPATERSDRWLQDGEWWFADLARELGMPGATLYRWVCNGWVQARQPGGAHGRWIVRADGEELDRLRQLRRCPRSWSEARRRRELETPKARPSR